MPRELHVRPLQLLYQSFWNAADWVYPPTCGGCGKLGKRFCDACREQVKVIDSASICAVCGEPLDAPGLCAHCSAARPAFTALRSWAVYQGGMRQAIHALKYRGDLGLSETFSRPLHGLLEAENWPVDLITCVPLNPHRMSERGFNQAELLARPLAFAAGLPCKPRALVRTRDTLSQVKLSRSERLVNLRNAFCADSHLVRNCDILIIDDVTTTGATMQGCAHALLEAGARQVYGLTLARAVLPDSFASKDAPA